MDAYSSIFSSVTLMRRFTWLLIMVGILFTSQACQPTPTASPAIPSPTPEILMITIDPNQRYQTIESFGASGAWWAQHVGGWQRGNLEQVIRLLFDPAEGIGLSAYRYNIGAGGGAEISDAWRRTQSFEISPGAYDWNRDANAVRVLKAVRDAGVSQFIAFANSPPPRLTRSGMVSGAVDGSSNLRQNKEAEFARYLVDIVSHLRDEKDIPIGWISPVNEPQWDWQPGKGQEGCHYEIDEIAALTKALQTEIASRGLDIAVIVPEAGEWKGAAAYMDGLLGNPEIAPGLPIFAVHSYWSQPEQKAPAAAYLQQNYPDVRLWMTEWTEMQSGRDTRMDAALVLAQTIHEDLTLGGVTSWQYWIAVSKYDWRDGLLYVDEIRQVPEETKRLWVMGNFSRFVRPGSVRIAAQVDSNNLLVSAFQPPEQEPLVIVVVNPSVNEMAAKLEISGDAWYQYSQFVTDSQRDLERAASGAIPNAFTFPPRSVSTLIITK
jgi:O-glycosyl hydrolase